MYDPVRNRYPTIHDATKGLESILDGQLESDDPTRTDVSGVTMFSRRLLSTCWQRKLFLDYNGAFCGLCPSSAEPGDKVVILLGCHNPMLLRKEPGKRSTNSTSQMENSGRSSLNRLTEACYTDRHSLGEAVLGPLPEKYRFKRSDKHGYAPAFRNIETGDIVFRYPRLEGCSVAAKNALCEHVNPDHDQGRATLMSALDEVGIKYEQFVLV